MQLRRMALVLVGICGCFVDEGNPGDDEVGDEESESDETSSGSTSDDATESESDSESDSESSESGQDTCTWALDWTTSPTKDVIVVADDEPTNLGALHLRASMMASSAGTHIAVASSCMPDQCGAPLGDGYEAIHLQSAGDPLEQAAGVMTSVGFLRPLTVLRVVVVTNADTGWSADMLAAHPLLGHAQIDVRTTLPGACGQQPGLEALVAATHGSYSCGDLEAGEILDDAIVLAAQPRCELFGDVAEGPDPDRVELDLALEGSDPNGPASAMPEGPTVCNNAPQGWTFVDQGLGHLGLCPVACRDVGDWTGLDASIDFPCMGG